MDLFTVNRWGVGDNMINDPSGVNNNRNTTNRVLPTCNNFTMWVPWFLPPGRVTIIPVEGQQGKGNRQKLRSTTSTSAMDNISSIISNTMVCTSEILGQVLQPQMGHEILVKAANVKTTQKFFTSAKPLLLDNDMEVKLQTYYMFF